MIKTRSDWLDLDRQRLLHPQHHPSESLNAQIWQRGDGIYLVDQEGRRYIDGLSGMWNVHVGHGRPELAEAARKQMEQLAFATAYAGSTHVGAIRLAEKIHEHIYPGIAAFFFTMGGSDATDTSLRIARFYWNALGKPHKTKIIARELSYHGSTIGGAAATGVSEFSAGFGPRLPGFVHIGSPYPYRFPADPHGQSAAIAAANLLEDAILREGPDTVAAFIAEPIQGGGGGVLVPDDGYFQRIREICTKYNVLLISDDVITGFGRTGKWFGLEHWGVEPDIVQFAKGITSGYIPMGGVGVSDAIKDVLDSVQPEKRWWHGYTCSAHPVAAAVALANIDIIEKEDLVRRAERAGQRLANHWQSLRGHSHVGDIRGLGLVWGIELVADKASKARFPESGEVGKKIRAKLHEKGLHTRLLGETICLAPPLVISDKELDLLAEIVVDTIHQYFQ